LGVGGKLHYARSCLGLTLSQVKQRTGLGESSVSDFENDKREPSLSQLQSLAEAYQQPVSFFLSEAPLPLQAVLWREKPIAGAEELEATFLRMCSQYRNLEAWAHEEVSLALPPVDGTAAAFNYMQAEGLAKNVRDRLSLGDRPALTLLSVLEEECGVKVFSLVFEPAGTAASARSEPFGAGILLNARNVRWRRNFDLAHELFHLCTWAVFRTETGQTTSLAATPQEEKLANSFAASFLMPPEAIRAAFGNKVRDEKLSFSHVFDLARQFDVSAEAILWRLFNLRLLSGNGDDIQKLAQRIIALSGAFEGRADTPAPRRPQRYHALAVKALRAGAISIGRFAQYLDIGRQEAMKYIQQEVTDDEEVPVAPA